jgi:hypothetical protein
MIQTQQPGYKHNNYDTKTTTMIQIQQLWYKYNNYDTNTTTRIQIQQPVYRTYHFPGLVQALQ